jgi:Kef-type K+ transport system membrane component KefB
VQTVFWDLLILMVVVWTAAVFLGRIGVPRIIGELLMGVIVGPAVLGWIEPNEIIEVLAELGIFFLILHTGIHTKPNEFFSALRISLGVAVVGAIVPFCVAIAVAYTFGLDNMAALFVGLAMTATAVVTTLDVLTELGLDTTRIARVIMASSILDDLLTLVLFSALVGVVEQGTLELAPVLWVATKAVLFLGLTIFAGRWLYPLLSHPFRSREGKGFTFVLVLGLGFGLLAEAIGLHLIVGAYLAGLFFREEVASPELLEKVEDRVYAIAYSFLGPIFFISLGFHITLDVLTGPGLGFLLTLTGTVLVGQVLSAGGMARLVGFGRVEALTVGVGMCGRAGLEFVLSALGLALGVIDVETFSVLIFTAFLLSLITPAALKGCAVLLSRRGAAALEKPAAEEGRESR